MQNLKSFVAADGTKYHIPQSKEAEFRADFGEEAQEAKRYRAKDGTHYTIPAADDEAFRADFPDAQETRRMSMADGSTRDFTMSELSKYLRSKEYRESADYKAPEQKSVTAAAVEGFDKEMFNQLGGDASAIRETAAETGNPLYKGYAYAQDLANSFVSGLLGGGSKITEGLGNAIGDNAVGRALVNEGRAGQATLQGAMPSDMLDTSGNTILNIGKQVAGVTGEFLPASIPGVGQAYAASVVSAGAANRAEQVFEAASQNGMSPVVANALALGAGGVDAVQNMLLMGKFKGIWGGETKAAANAAKVGMVRRLLTDSAKTGATMGEGAMLGDVANQIAGIDEEGKVVTPKPFSAKRMLKAGFDGFIEGGMFHLVNSAAHSMPKAVQWVSEAKERSESRQMAIQSFRDALDTPEGRTLVFGNSPEAAYKIFEARRKGEDVSRKMLKALGVPDGVAPTAADRNALGDALMKDYDAYKKWQLKQPDKLQSQALDDTILTFAAETAKETTDAIRDKVLNKIEDAKELDDPEKRERLVGEAFEEWAKENPQPKKAEEPPKATEKPAEKKAGADGDREFLTKIADSHEFTEYTNPEYATQPLSVDDMRAEYKKRLSELTNEEVQELADARRKMEEADARLDEVLKGEDFRAIDEADRARDEAIGRFQDIESRLKISDWHIANIIEAREASGERSAPKTGNEPSKPAESVETPSRAADAKPVPDGKGKMAKPKKPAASKDSGAEQDYGVTMFEEPAVEGGGVKYVVKDGPSDSHRMMFDTKGEAEARLKQIRDLRRRITEAPTATLSDGTTVHLLKTDKGWIPFDEKYNDLRHGLYNTASSKAGAIKVAEKGRAWAKDLAAENKAFAESKGAKPKSAEIETREITPGDNGPAPEGWRYLRAGGEKNVAVRLPDEKTFADYVEKNFGKIDGKVDLGAGGVTAGGKTYSINDILLKMAGVRDEVRPMGENATKVPDGKGKMKPVEPISDREGKIAKAAEIISEQVRKKTGDKNFTADNARQSAESLVKAIEDKNADALRNRFNGLNQGSVKAFEALTGLKMPRTQKGQHEVVDRFCGISPEERAKIDRERAEARQTEAERRQREQSLKDGEEAVKKMRVQLPDGKVATVDELVRQGWTVEKSKRGAANYLRVKRPDGGGYFRFNETTAYDYLKKLEEEVRASKPKPDGKGKMVKAEPKPAESTETSELRKSFNKTVTSALSQEGRPTDNLHDAAERLIDTIKENYEGDERVEKALDKALAKFKDENPAELNISPADSARLFKEFADNLALDYKIPGYYGQVEAPEYKGRKMGVGVVDDIQETLFQARGEYTGTAVADEGVFDELPFRDINYEKLTRQDRSYLSKLENEVENALNDLRYDGLEFEVSGVLTEESRRLVDAYTEARDNLNRFLEQAEKYQHLKRDKNGRPLLALAPTEDMTATEVKSPEQEIEERVDLRRLDPKRRSDPKVLEWAKKHGRTITDGMVTPDAVREYDETMTEAAGRAVKRWFPDMKIVAHKFGEKIKRGVHVLEQRIDDPATIAELEKDTVSRLRSMQLRDGKLYPPMAGKVKSGESGKAEWQEPSEPGIWYRADEHPELLDKNGKFTLIKGNGETIKAAYNPYWHMSKTALNDQFSSAYKRPELVTVEVSAPRSEAEAKRGDGYWATGAKDPVGEHDWPKGPVSGQLAKAGAPARKVTLTRHNKIVRVLSTEEVADRIKAEIDACPRKDVQVEVPFNCVTPQLRDALVERGVKIGQPARLSGAALNEAKTAYRNWKADKAAKVNGGGERQYLRDTSGRTLGWFDPKSKEVHLLPGADPRTVAHEIMWHGTRDYMTNLAAKGDARAQKFLDMMHDVEKNIPEELKKKVLSLYARGGTPVSQDTLMNEFGAWFTMEKGGKALEQAMKTAEGRNWFAKAFHTVKEMYKDFLSRHGKNRVDLSAVDSMTREEFVDWLAEQFASGKTLGNIKGEPKKVLSTEETKMQAYRRKAYDNNAAVRDLERDIEKKTGQKISADESVEAANALKYGLKEATNIEVQGKMADFRKVLDESGIHYADLEYYAALKAAAGRDAKIDKRNIDKLTADMQAAGASAQEIANAVANYKSTNGSHIDPREAKKMLAEIENGADAAKYKKAYDELRKIIDETLAVQEQAGLVGKGDAAQWRAEEPNYIPFKNEYDAETGEWNGRGSSLNLTRPEHQMAKGRQSAAGDIIAHVFMDHQAAKHRAIENAVRQKLAKLVRANKELGKVEILDKDAVRNIERDDPNVVVFKEGGRAYAIRLEGTRGAAIANAFTQRNLLKMGWADKGFSVFGKKVSFRDFARWSSGMATRYSPTFSIRNTTKDNIELANIVYSERGPIAGTKWMGDYIANRAKMAKTLAKYVTTGKIDAGTAEGSILDRYIKAGGLIAGGVQAEGVASIKAKLSPDAIAKEMRRGKSKTAAAAKHVLESIEYLNEYAEMATRLGAFATEVKGGKSDAEAALFSRRVTVDFNRHGDYTPAFSVFRLFSNSTLGATARAAAALTKSKYGAAAAATMFANGLAQAFIEHESNADEDKRRSATGEATGKDVSEYDRKTALFYFRKGDKVYRIAQHESPFSLITYAGNCVGRWMCGELDGEAVAKNLGVSAAELAYNFTPMGQINLTSSRGGFVNDFKAAIISGIVPSALQPIAEIAWNMDYKGDTIQRQLFNNADPRSYNGKDNSPEWSKFLAERMNDATGGNAGRQGWVDISPEVIQKLVEGYGKNAMRDISTAISVGDAIIKGELPKLDVRNKPVKRDFVRPLDGNDRRYNDALSAYKADVNELSRMEESWTDEQYNAYIDAHPWVKDKATKKDIEEIGKLRKLERGYIFRNGKAVPHEWTEDELKEFKAERLERQARVLKDMGR